ncbi:MAG TPA: PTS sugar transporter subunit IIB [Candidatus Limnocylindrales bacterium]|nr:PTS sugar transporter subunit IIB [Candidatus Limnocylindrales bacterium]
MPLVLARVDDRLIHGQVAYGWGKALHPTLFLVVSDTLAADPDRACLYLFAVPEGAAGRVVSVDEALAPDARAAAERERTVLLFSGLEEPLRLVEAGYPLSALNLGGMHHAPGKEAVLPYLFLDGADRERLRRLDARGVSIAAQDLPANPAHPLAELLSRWSPS